MKESYDKKTSRLLLIVFALLLVGIIVGTLQNKFSEITASVISKITKDSLFDVSTDIPSSYREITSGENLLASIKLINLGADKRVDVFLDYSITDINGMAIMTQSETVAIETQANLVRYFSLPEKIPYGDYELNTKLSYDGKEARAKSSFKVTKEKTNMPGYFYIMPAILAVLAIIVFSSNHVKIVIGK